MAYWSVEYDSSDKISSIADNLIGGLKKSEKDGNNYATTIMKILGVYPSRNVLDKFLEIRYNYKQFYLKEREQSVNEEKSVQSLEIAKIYEFLRTHGKKTWIYLMEFAKMSTTTSLMV